MGRQIQLGRGEAGPGMCSRGTWCGDGSTRGRQRALVLCSFPTEAAAEHGDAEDGAREGLAKGRWIWATEGGEGRQEAVDSGGGCDALLQDTCARKGSGRKRGKAKEEQG